MSLFMSRKDLLSQRSQVNLTVVPGATSIENLLHFVLSYQAASLLTVCSESNKNKDFEYHELYLGLFTDYVPDATEPLLNRKARDQRDFAKRERSP
ncbi:hypothetical protein SNOG_03138 [Parastagonospora nodorum SN15]|uniref:Uncharacterized protein n=1 Tax=Phaeosphaeria nodorum (strain SN15 / ATCC MYA-4574 / FGSC 10173) TaxID=321614 RepID=Q0UYM6_PHANO|nr:hypothetical protein SNOG_03138 [Parastagonospora nodorum SN15]EAT89869.1 hypothetical protein SNOG_03138 [Parastagonospora nodorum SN15]